MIFSEFKHSWAALQGERYLTRILLVLLIIANLLLASYMTRQDAIITLVPPVIDEEMEILQNDASETFKKSWGLHIATLVGNVKASNVDFVVKSLEPLLDTSIVSRTRSMLAEQIETIKRERLSTSFTPTLVSYERSTQKVFVSGQQEITGRNEDAISNTRTYEIGVEIRQYRPVIFHIDAYNEKPKYTQPK